MKAIWADLEPFLRDAPRPAPRPAVSETSPKAVSKLTPVQISLPAQVTPAIRQMDEDAIRAQARAKVKPRPAPSSTSFLDALPSQIRDMAIRNAAAAAIRKWCREQGAGPAMRPLLFKKKAEVAKAAKRARDQKQKEEDAQKQAAMRERKQAVIEQMVRKMYSPLMSRFVRGEIERALREEESGPTGEEIPVVVDGHDGVKPVVIEGLVNRGMFSERYIREKFAGYRIALDENQKPKIRFRCNGSRFDLLLYLATEQDCNRLLAQKAVSIDYGYAKLAIDQGDPGTAVWESFTGQDVMPQTPSKNLDDFAVVKGRRGVAKMIPMLANDWVPDGKPGAAEVK
jgi:hypothetical protein